MPALPNPDYLSHPKMKAATEQIGREQQIEALARFLPAFQQNYLSWMQTGRPDYEARIGEGDEALAELQQAGIVLLKIDPVLKAEIAALAAPILEGLEQKIRAFEGKPKFRDMNVELDRTKQAGLYKLIDQAMRDLGVYDVARAYVRRDVRIKKLFVQVNNERETRTRYGALGDDGLPALKTEYWHVDSDIWPCAKVLIYVNEVDADHGPLRYVPGSHRAVDDFEMVVRKTNDDLKLPANLFLALPDELRMHALFGPFLRGDEPQSAELLTSERSLYGQGKDLILFDNNGVHRGGFVRSGSRHIIQCLFEAG